MGSPNRSWRSPLVVINIWKLSPIYETCVSLIYSITNIKHAAQGKDATKCSQSDFQVGGENLPWGVNLGYSFRITFQKLKINNKNNSMKHTLLPVLRRAVLQFTIRHLNHLSNINSAILWIFHKKKIIIQLALVMELIW